VETAQPESAVAIPVSTEEPEKIEATQPPVSATPPKKPLPEEAVPTPASSKAPPAALTSPNANLSSPYAAPTSQPSSSSSKGKQPVLYPRVVPYVPAPPPLGSSVRLVPPPPLYQHATFSTYVDDDDNDGFPGMGTVPQHLAFASPSPHRGAVGAVGGEWTNSSSALRGPPLSPSSSSWRSVGGRGGGGGRRAVPPAVPPPPFVDPSSTSASAAFLNALTVGVSAGHPSPRREPPMQQTPLLLRGAPATSPATTSAENNVCSYPDIPTSVFYPRGTAQPGSANRLEGQGLPHQEKEQESQLWDQLGRMVNQTQERRVGGVGEWNRGYGSYQEGPAAGSASYRDSPHLSVPNRQRHGDTFDDRSFQGGLYSGQLASPSSHRPSSPENGYSHRPNEVWGNPGNVYDLDHDHYLQSSGMPAGLVPAGSLRSPRLCD